MEIDKKIIKKLIESLEELKKTFNKSGEQLYTTETSKSEEVVEVENSKSVKSPIIGTAYLAPEPGAKPFVEVGKKIKKGDTVMIVEAMKTMNHIPSPHNGIIKKITVQDGQPVEYDQVLVLVE